MIQNQQVLELALLAGRILLQNGAEILRVQETIIHILEAFGIRDHDVYVISNAVFTTVGEVTLPCHAIRFIPMGGVHLGRIAAVNALSREIEANGGAAGVEEYTRRLKECEKIPKNPPWVQLLACSLGAASFCYIMGGSVWDSVGAFLVGLVLQGYLFFTERKRTNKFIALIFSGMLITLCCNLLVGAGLGNSVDAMIIGDSMPLVPGVLLTTAIRDFFNSDFLAGTIHLVDALLVAASIAVGVGTMLYLWSLLAGVAL